MSVMGGVLRKTGTYQTQVASAEKQAASLAWEASAAEKLGGWGLGGPSGAVCLKPGAPDGDWGQGTFIRKITGFNKPSKANEESFSAAVEDVAAVCARGEDTAIPTSSRDRPAWLRRT